VQKLPGAKANVSRFSGNLLFLLTTSYKPLTTAEGKKHVLHSAPYGIRISPE